MKRLGNRLRIIILCIGWIPNIFAITTSFINETQERVHINLTFVDSTFISPTHSFDLSPYEPYIIDVPTCVKTIKITGPYPYVYQTDRTACPDISKESYVIREMQAVDGYLKYIEKTG